MDFILEIPNNLSNEMCETIMKRFDNDERARRGVTADFKADSQIKKSKDLMISAYDDWKDVDEYLHKQLNAGITKYKEHIKKKVGGQTSWGKYHIEDTGYQMQKTGVGEYYSWHSDELFGKQRLFTFLWYLNTFDITDEGGGTAFHPSIGDGGKIIQPEQGKLILFPATWTYIHMGMPVITPDKNKYVCTGWIRSDDVV